MQCSVCCDKWHYGSSVKDATPNLDLASRLTKERCLTIHSIMQSPVFWLDLQIIQCAGNSDTEGSRKDLLTIPPHFHRSAGLPDIQTSSQVFQVHPLGTSISSPYTLLSLQGYTVFFKLINLFTSMFHYKIAILHAKRFLLQTLVSPINTLYIFYLSMPI